MVILKRIGNRWDGNGNSRSLELLKAVTRSLEVKLRLKALDLAATLTPRHTTTKIVFADVE